MVDGAVVQSVYGPAASSRISSGWVLVGVTVGGERWPTNESRERVVELLSGLEPGEEVGFTFEVRA